MSNSYPASRSARAARPQGWPSARRGPSVHRCRASCADPMAPCADADPRHRRGLDRDHAARARVARRAARAVLGHRRHRPARAVGGRLPGHRAARRRVGDYDRRPPLHAEAGRAASFIEAPIRERHLIWHDAPDRVLAQSPWAALLVSLHGTNIHTRYVSVDHLPPEDADIVRGTSPISGAAGPAHRAGRDDARSGRAPGRAAVRARRAVAQPVPRLARARAAAGRRGRHPVPPGGRPRGDARPVAVRRAARPDELRARTLTERFTDERALHAALASTATERRDHTLRAA